MLLSRKKYSYLHHHNSLMKLETIVGTITIWDCTSDLQVPGRVRPGSSSCQTQEVSSLVFQRSGAPRGCTASTKSPTSGRMLWKCLPVEPGTQEHRLWFRAGTSKVLSKHRPRAPSAWAGASQHRSWCWWPCDQALFVVYQRRCFACSCKFSWVGRRLPSFFWVVPQLLAFIQVATFEVIEKGAGLENRAKRATQTGLWFPDVCFLLLRLSLNDDAFKEIPFRSFCSVVHCVMLAASYGLASRLMVLHESFSQAAAAGTPTAWKRFRSDYQNQLKTPNRADEEASAWVAFISEWDVGSRRSVSMLFFGVVFVRQPRRRR